MPAAARFDDTCTGHGCYGARKNDQGSGNVFINSKEAHRETDHWITHCCGPACHDSKLSAGSGTVYTNSLQQGRVGDPIDCGSAVAKGSGNVFVGG